MSRGAGDGQRPEDSRGDEVAPGRGQNRPALSLVNTTLLGRFEAPCDPETGEVYRTGVRGSLIEYPDGGGELTATLVRERQTELQRYESELQRFGAFEANRRAEERRQVRESVDPEEREERSRQEAARRARSRVRRIVRYYGLAYMVTLTFPGSGVHDYDRALRCLQDFVHDHGEVLRLGGHYVAVPELHPGGHGWHWHVLVRRRFTRAELAALRREWTEFLGRKGMEPSGGARFARIDVKGWESATAAASYAAKYAGKTFEGAGVAKGRRRFLASLRAEVESRGFVAETVAEVAQVVRDEVPSAHIIEVPAEEGRPAIVWAGWDRER